MGDIALPNVNYESQWQAQRFNKSFQQELETLKKEVYSEGLQVEEEGLTDIIRKKTKQFDAPPQSTTESEAAPDSHTEKVALVDRERNNAAAIPDHNEGGGAAKHNFKSIPNPPTEAPPLQLHNAHHEGDEEEQSTVVATIIDNGNSSTRHSQPPPPPPPFNSTVKVAPLQTDPEIVPAKNASAAVVRHNETDKIQSNSKDIVIDDFNWNGGSTSSSTTNGNNNRRGSTLSPSTGNNRQRNRRQQQQQQRRHKVVTSRLHHHLPHQMEEPEDAAISRDELTMGIGLADFQYTDSHRRVTRAATAKKERIWDYGVIPYEIDANFSGAHKALFVMVSQTRNMQKGQFN